MFRIQSLILFSVITLSACGGSGDEESNNDTPDESKSDLDTVTVRVQNDLAYNRPITFMEDTCLQHGVMSTVIESDYFLGFTSQADPSSDEALTQLVQSAQIEAEDLLKQLHITSTDINIDPEDVSTKLLLCSNKAPTESGGQAHGDGSGIIFPAYDRPDGNAAELNAGSGHRKTLKHEIMHSVESRIAVRPDLYNSRNEANHPEVVDEWFQEGLAEHVVSRVNVDIGEVDSIISAAGGFNPLSYGRYSDAGGAPLNNYYDLFETAVKFLLTPVENGGAGNSIEQVISLYKTMKVYSEDLSTYYLTHGETGTGNFNGTPIIDDTYGCGMNVECYRNTAESANGVAKLAFEAAFNATMKKNGDPLTFEEFEANFYEGERWVENFLAGNRNF